MRTALLALVALSVAIGGGAASVWYALQAQEGIGAVTIGRWTTYPELGTPDANPYLRARVARDGLLALGRTEGLSFVSERDTRGRLIQRRCRYTIRGTLPPARLWTVHAADTGMAPISSAGRLGNSLNSQNVLYDDANSVAIAVGRNPAPGNWLPVSGDGRMLLVLTLYDTPLSGAGGMNGVRLPEIINDGCDA
ncbi:DUF1214 domain-containing protein [Pseudaminobacter sp. 19-2017]|uniref:DUF1214 domain-containing protein n=1 Tax=Pseudaminobacter soli (ex Zhang et al. 2022) TaxID=2831468 RepID=A0A942E453_9HYPH|nr:DUF1214 domain-containing protein [Pseudaminobacter soli]